MEQTIVIIGQHLENKISPAVYELAACAKILQAGSDLSVKIILAGNEILPMATQLAMETGLDVIVITAHQSNVTQTQILKSVPAGFFMELNPRYVCIHHNSFGQETASALAIKLNAACITGVEKITFQKGGFTFGRKVFNDKICANLDSDASLTVLTIQSGATEPLRPGNTKKGTVQIATPALEPFPAHHLGYGADTLDTSRLADAETIVAAGNGIGKSENLELIYRLAGLFHKSSVAGSRPVCDKKWLEYNQQVGATGATVKPKLYVACGISGASQHIAGMRDSKMIVAINTDPRAAIHQFADICIIEDLSVFIPVFEDVCQKEKDGP